VSAYHHQNGDCDSYTCRYCEWEDELERIERAHNGEEEE
jgi:hypothetical protein